MWEQTWIVPGEEIGIGVADLLPADVTVSADGSEFETTIPGTDIDLSLGEMCSSCAAANGFTVPKPEFTYTLNTTSALPAALVSATVTGDRFALRMAHDLNFDPLRPDSAAGADRGYLVVEVTSNGALVGRDSISGNDVAFDSATVLTPEIPIQTVEVTGDLDIQVRIYSPAGDPTLVDTGDTLGIEIAPATVTLSEATIDAGAITVDGTPVALNFEGVDSALVSRIQSGGLLLDVVNPFGLEGTLNLTFDMGSSTLTRTLNLTSAPTSTLSVAFSGAELQDMLGAGEVQVTAQGSLSAAGGTITVHPEDELIMESQFELVILVGGTEGGE